MKADNLVSDCGGPFSERLETLMRDEDVDNVLTCVPQHVDEPHVFGVDFLRPAPDR
jgi:hypothetical protein